MSVSLRGGWCARCPGCPVRTGSDCAGVVLLPCRWGDLCWSGGCGQGAEPLPAGQECLGPGPVWADGEGSLAGVGGEFRGEVPDPVAEGTGVGVAEPGVVAVAEEAGPGGEVGGDVRCDDPAAVDLPGFRWQPAQAHGFRGADAGGFDAGVLAVHDVDVLRVVAAGDAADPGAGDVRAGDRVPPAAFLFVGGQVAHLRRDGLTRRTIQRSPSGQFPALVIRPVTSATSLSSSALPSWAIPGF